MAVTKINRLTDDFIPQQIEKQSQLQQRLDLFSASSFENKGVGSVTFADGTRVDIPRLSEEQQQFLATQQATLSPEQLLKVNAAAMSLSNAVNNELATNPKATTLAATSSAFQAQAQSALASYSAAYTSGSGGGAPGTVIGCVTNSVQLQESQLADYANEVKARLDMGHEMTTDITELNGIVSAGTYPQTLTYTDGNGQKQTATLNNAADADNLLTTLQQNKSDMSNITNEMQSELQNMMQNYSAAINLLSDMLKQMHSDMMATINNIKD